MNDQPAIDAIRGLLGEDFDDLITELRSKAQLMRNAVAHLPEDNPARIQATQEAQKSESIADRLQGPQP